MPFDAGPDQHVRSVKMDSESLPSLSEATCGRGPTGRRELGGGGRLGGGAELKGGRAGDIRGCRGASAAGRTGTADGLDRTGWPRKVLSGATAARYPAINWSRSASTYGLLGTLFYLALGNVGHDQRDLPMSWSRC